LQNDPTGGDKVIKNVNIRLPSHERELIVNNNREKSSNNIPYVKLRHTLLLLTLRVFFSSSFSCGAGIV
jgi:hypothetical protein